MNSSWASETISVSFTHRVIFTTGVFDRSNPILASLMATCGSGPHKVLVVMDSGVVTKTSDLFERVLLYSGAHNGLLDVVEVPVVIPGGEACKDGLKWAEVVGHAVLGNGLCRQSFVAIVGGGAVLDAAGLGATLAHRGVRMIRFPTTSLAQADAGVGVKCAVNVAGRKNAFGAFTVPLAVISDFEFLETLDVRDLRGGLAEAVKVAVLRDQSFFESLWRNRAAHGRGARPQLHAAIKRCARLHIDQIVRGGDPFESGSARPLDLGHWLAHALEEATLGEIRHGEAVAIGVAVDAIYSSALGWLSRKDLRRVIELLTKVGFALDHEALQRIDIGKAIKRFCEHLGRGVSWTVLRGIGSSQQESHVDLDLLQRCVENVATHNTKILRSRVLSG